MASRVRVIYVGRVQGVGFRATAASVARKHAVTGYVRNQPDGTVELIAEGDDAEVDCFLNAVANRMRGNITRAEREPAAATGEFEGFDVVR